MLAIFDIDGTICDSQEVEGVCFAKAIESVTGRSLSTLDWNSYPEPTNSAIVQGLLVGDADLKRKEKDIESMFVSLLAEACPKYPEDFSPVAGAVEFIRQLRKSNICSVAIASGCFESSARFKLACCGITLETFPHATSTDTPLRKDIIRLAASRAGFEPDSVVYFADGLWDYRASLVLGIPMIGIGRQHKALESAGVEHTFRDYSGLEEIIGVLQKLRSGPNQALHWIAEKAGSQ